MFSAVDSPSQRSRCNRRFTAYATHVAKSHPSCYPDGRYGCFPSNPVTKVFRTKSSQQATTFSGTRVFPRSRALFGNLDYNCERRSAYSIPNVQEYWEKMNRSTTG